MSGETGICKALLAVMGDIGAIGKDRMNTGQGYKFRGIDDVYNTLNPLMVEHGVFCVPRVTKVVREDRTSSGGKGLIYTMLEVDYDFRVADGSFLTAHVAGEGMDSGDKSLNKAMSAAHKYALLQMFCIPTEEGELKDSEQDTHELSGNQKSEPTKTPASQQPPTTTGKICPECRKPMKLRKPKAGGDEFWGCTGYPACKHTEPREGDMKGWWVQVTRKLEGTDISIEGFKRWLVATFEVGSSKELTLKQKEEILQKLNNDEDLREISSEAQQLIDAEASTAGTEG